MRVVEEFGSKAVEAVDLVAAVVVRWRSHPEAQGGLKWCWFRLVQTLLFRRRAKLEPKSR